MVYSKAKAGIIFVQNMGYTKKALQGVSWAWGLSLSSRLISFFKVIILARILTPDQFGVYGIALLILALLETLTEMGINVILVQEKEDIDKYINSAWIISICRGIAISLAMIIFAPLIANFFHSKDVLYLLLLFSLAPFIRGFINPSEVKFQKDLKFNIEFRFRFIILLLDCIVSLVLAFFTHLALSLAIGFIAGVVLELILSFVFISPRPRFIINKVYLVRFFHSGKWITLSGIFNYLFHNFDNIVVGRILGASSLGIYEMAYNISMLPITDVSDVISKVTFPVYSLISGDSARLRKAFLKSLLLLSIITIPFGIIIFAFPYQIVNIVLGQKWLSMVKVLQILVIFGVIRAISGSCSALFLSVGKQKYITMVTLASIIGLAVTIIPLVNQFGIYGAGISALIGSLVALPFMLYYTIKVFAGGYYEKS